MSFQMPAAPKKSDKDMKDFTLQVYIFKDSIKTVSFSLTKWYN